MRPVTDCVLDVAINLGGLREGLECVQSTASEEGTMPCRVNRLTVNKD